MLLSIILLAFIAGANCDYTRVCYYTNWAQYRTAPQNFFPEDVNPYLCTHYVFYFSYLWNNHLNTREWNDEDMYRRFNYYIHTNNPSAKTLLATDGEFSPMLASAQNRSEFITSSISYLRNFDFDGLDLDFQYPKINDRESYTLLCQETRAAFEQEAINTGNQRLLLTAALPAFKLDLDNGYEIAAISQALDYISVKAYDYHLATAPITGHNSPLYGRSSEVGNNTELNQDWSANYLFENGCPKEKIVVGMAAYGRCFILADPSQNGMGAPAIGTCTPGYYTQIPGFLSYYEVCPHIEDGSTVIQWHGEHQVNYAYSYTDWLAYDSVEGVRIKMQWLKNSGYSGFMFWALDLDDFNGQQCGHGGNYPLLFTMVDELYDGITTMPPTTVPDNVCGFPTACDINLDGFFPDPQDCDGFYQCLTGVPYYTQCQPGTIYDPFYLRCDYIYNVAIDYICCKCPEKGVDHGQGPC